MVRRQFKALIAMLQTQLGAIQEIIEKQVGATRDQTETERKQWESTSKEIVRAVISTEDTQNYKREDRAYREKNYRVQKFLAFITFWAFLAAAFAAGGAIYYAKIAARQACIMNSTLQEIKRQTPFIKQSADAATTAADVSREALYSVQRAYVGFPPVPEIRIFSLQNGPPLVTIQMPIENAGTTLARTVEDRISCVTPFGMLPSGFTFPDIKGGKKLKCGTPSATVGETTIAAKATVFSQTILIDYDKLVEFIQQHPVENANSLRETGRPGRAVFLYGWVTYRDVFKGTPEHLTEFCLHLTALSLQGTSEQSQWTYCPIHNCSDDDCPDYNKHIKESDDRPIHRPN